MRACVAVIIGIACCGSARAAGLEFRLVDADSGQRLSGVQVERWASQWQPRILLPPGRFWFPAGEPADTDEGGTVHFESYKSDDLYYFTARSYERAVVDSTWFGWEVSNDPSKKYQRLSRQDGCYVVPLNKK